MTTTVKGRSGKNPTLSQRATPQLMKIIGKRDRNTRGLAKVVSAYEYMRDTYTELEHDEAAFVDALVTLDTAKFAILQERRNLTVALLAERDHQEQTG